MPERRPAAGDAGRRRRHHVRHRDRTSATRSTPAAAGRSGTTSGRARRASTGGHANRGVAVAGDRVFMETDNAHIIALNRFTGELLWDTRARRLAQELLGLVGAAARRQPGHLRRRRRRARRQRVRRGARSGDRQGSLALLDRAEAGRAGIGDLAGQGHRSRRRADLVHRQLRSRARPRLLADRQSEQGVQRRRSQGRQPLLATASSRSIARPAR